MDTLLLRCYEKLPPQGAVEDIAPGQYKLHTIIFRHTKTALLRKNNQVMYEGKNKLR